MKTPWISFAFLIAMATIVMAEPATQPAADVVFHISPPLAKKVEAVEPFVYVSMTTTFGEMKTAVKKPLDQLVDQHRSAIKGPVAFVFTGITDDIKKPFTLDMGFKVVPWFKPQGDDKTKTLAAFPCMTVYYTGPIAHISEAYHRIYPAVFEHGLRPTGEVREIYLYWEGEDSPNNVIEIQVGTRSGENHE